MEYINTTDETENAAWAQKAFESAEDKKARKNLRNVLVQVLSPHYATDTTGLIAAAEQIEAYVLAD